ncbi:unnamed protein product [Urochloa humidicola]
MLILSPFTRCWNAGCLEPHSVLFLPLFSLRDLCGKACARIQRSRGHRAVEGRGRVSGGGHRRSEPAAMAAAVRLAQRVRLEPSQAAGMAGATVEAGGRGGRRGGSRI